MVGTIMLDVTSGHERRVHEAERGAITESFNVKRWHVGEGWCTLTPLLTCRARPDLTPRVEKGGRLRLSEDLHWRYALKI